MNPLRIKKKFTQSHPLSTNPVYPGGRNDKPLNPQLSDTTKSVNNQTAQPFFPSRDIRFPDRIVIEQGIYFTGRTDGEVHLTAEWVEIIDDVADVKANNNSPLRSVHNVKRVIDFSQPAFYKLKGADGKVEFPDSRYLLLL
jgi:hypothetical protein